ncbi:hypothetical protein [Corynebacterium lujinxingii]|uniref:Uncharacterized protein n=1 Tax=Corynebacterium lujinxingii TaxID=2763010 RepID=A0A7H0K0Q5_9CORY|nr:hypothetical protein [Corynebacterium lujinxingii]MBC3179384.1 hypothetical protein [Corynebacterium lujinxingii]NNO11492.1 hypothetical protein [Corynebacterium lujinxingii]QNP90871.1 hypothetical protein IAU68_03650 [Corynebacterium lujinxingii]
MTEPVYDYYATRIVQDLEDDLYDSKERIQRLRRQNDELAAENERLRDGVERALGVLKQSSPSKGLHARIILTDLLDGDTE